MVNYTYDEWGNPLSVTGSQAATIGQKNPLRYRGYYYDSETGFYHLQSRYYDPEIGRFLNADGLVSTGQGILGTNMFAYCNNNPVNMLDTSGTLPLYLPFNFVIKCPHGNVDKNECHCCTGNVLLNTKNCCNGPMPVVTSVTKHTTTSYPTDGRTVTSSFGTRTDPLNGKKAMHNAIDISANGGLTIYAPITGTFKGLVGNNGGYGNRIIIEDDNYKMYLNHLDSIIWDATTVTAGSVVGVMGATGRVTGVHLDFQVYDKKRGTYIDPTILYPDYK